MGPATSRNEPFSGAMPSIGTSPCVGRIPTRLWKLDGLWIDRPVSVPRPSTAMEALTALAVPPDDPPGAFRYCEGFRVTPSAVELERRPSLAKSGRLVLPMMTAPAALSRATTEESVDGTMSIPPVLDEKPW